MHIIVRLSNPESSWRTVTFPYRIFEPQTGRTSFPWTPGTKPYLDGMLSVDPYGARSSLPEFCKLIERHIASLPISKMRFSKTNCRALEIKIPRETPCDCDRVWAQIKQLLDLHFGLTVKNEGDYELELLSAEETDSAKVAA